MEDLNRYLTAHRGLLSLEQAISCELSEEDVVRKLIWKNEPLISIIGKGVDGKVYRITDEYVVKVLSQNYYNRDIAYEYNIARDLYAAGISVPKPIGVFDVELTSGREKGFVMESARNDEVSMVKRHKLNHGLNRELEKCRESGFVPGDSGGWRRRRGHNVLYDKKQDKIYLIDFIRWERKE